MAARWIEFVTGSLEQKKQWRQYKARVKPLPEPYRAAAEAVERYYMSSGSIPDDGGKIVEMFNDLGDMWERAAIDGTAVRDIVGDDPAEFAESFAQAYTGRRWIDTERERLTKASDEADEEQK